MKKRAWIFLISTIILAMTMVGCTDLDDMDLSCRIPLTEYSDMVGSWKELVSFRDSRRTDGLFNSFFTFVRLRDFIQMRNTPTTFMAGGTTYTLHYDVGESPVLHDSYGSPVPLINARTTREGDWRQQIRCSLANVGQAISYDEYHTLAFTLPESGRTCEIWARSWVKVTIRKEQRSRTDFHGKTVYYDYPYAETSWGFTTKVGIHYYMRGRYIIPGEKRDVTLAVLLTDTNLDGRITEQDSVYIQPEAKGGTKGGLRGANYPMNQLIQVTGTQAYVLNLITQPGMNGTQYFLDIQRR